MPGSNQTQSKTFRSAKLIASFRSSPVLRNQTLLAVSLAIGASYAGIGMVVPVRVLYAESRGASLAIIGAMASAYLISNFLFQYPSGWVADRWGHKRVMVIGLMFQAILSLLYLLIADPILFVVLRFAEGIAAAAVLPSARALIADSVSAESRGEAYGIFSSFFNVGFLLGPGLGGLLATTGYATAFVGAVLFRLLAIVLVLLLIKTEVKGSSISLEGSTVDTPRNILFTLPLIGAYILAFGDYLYLGFDLTLTPLWMHDHLRASVAVIGLAYVMFALPNVIVSPIGGRIADRTRRSMLILIFGLLQVPLYLSYGLANMAIVVVVLFGVHGLFYALIQPAVDAHVATASSRSTRARVQGAYSTAGLLGAFAGASGFSFLYALNFRLPLFAMGVGFGICVVVGGFIVRISEARGLVPSALDKQQ